MSDANAKPIDVTGARDYQRQADEKRRDRHFQVRLDEKLAAQLQHYADRNHNGVKNAACKAILSKFFNAK